MPSLVIIIIVVIIHKDRVLRKLKARLERQPSEHRMSLGAV